MLQSHNPTQAKAWKHLENLYQQAKNKTIKQLFTENPQRSEDFSLNFENMYVDYSKTLLTLDIKNQLIELAKFCGLQEAIQAMFTGQKINQTEGRAVLHTALRNAFINEPLILDGVDIKIRIKQVLEKMKLFCNRVQTGEFLGYNGKKITTIVNIGIGGSDLGPYMVTEALKPYWVKGIQTYFVSNVDANHIKFVLEKIKAEDTLFIIASKTFTTQETMANAQTAKAWFLNDVGDSQHIAQHFVALSTNSKAVKDFGIAEDLQFEFWDWVGGRYSLWSAIGLSIALTIGYKHFEDLLLGASKMDDHFKTAPFENNIPVMMALVGIWHVNFCNYNQLAILPYNQLLHRFPAFLQQADMESNGKYVNRHGETLDYSTGPTIFGEAGTNGQHAFYQLLHQGTQIIPCDFIGVVNATSDHKNQQDILFANFIAQTEALMNGLSIEEVCKTETNTKIQPFKVFQGNRPTMSIVLKDLTPYNLGSMIAMYEHKIFVQGVIWNIFSFDQFGVELGKKLANVVLKDFEKNTNTHDGSTETLINLYKKWVHASI